MYELDIYNTLLSYIQHRKPGSENINTVADALSRCRGTIPRQILGSAKYTDDWYYILCDAIYRIFERIDHEFVEMALDIYTMCHGLSPELLHFIRIFLRETNQGKTGRFHQFQIEERWEKAQSIISEIITVINEADDEISYLSSRPELIYFALLYNNMTPSTPVMKNKNEALSKPIVASDKRITR